MWQVFSGVIWQPGAAAQAALSYSAYSSSEAYTEEERVMVEIVEGEGKSVPALSAATTPAGTPRVEVQRMVEEGEEILI